MQTAVPRVNEHKRGGRYKEALEIVAALRQEIDRFFEQVMVMAENEEVRKNRLALLSELLREFTTIADFSEMGGEGRN
jgi:glycyl-tRNA synthetase beta chain